MKLFGGQVIKVQWLSLILPLYWNVARVIGLKVVPGKTFTQIAENSFRITMVRTYTHWQTRSHLCNLFRLLLLLKLATRTPAVRLSASKLMTMTLFCALWLPARSINNFWISLLLRVNKLPSPSKVNSKSRRGMSCRGGGCSTQLTNL